MRMKCSFTLTFAFIWLFSSVFAQSLSSLQRAFKALGYEPALNYHSKFETKIYEEWQIKNEINRMDLLLAVDPEITESEVFSAKEKMQELYTELDAKGINEKPLKRQVNMIRQGLRKRFFKDFEIVATPLQTFKKGIYSNQTGCALHALAFDHYEVPYQIWSDALVATIVADPFGNFGPPIEISPLSLNAQLPFFDQEEQANYIKFLLASGIVKRKDVMQKGREELFYQYYLPQEDLLFHEFVGMIYLQQGVQDRVLKLYKRSVAQLEKAFLFRPSYAIKYQLYRSRISVLGNPTYGNWQEIQDLISLYKILPSADLREFMSKSFVWITAEYLIKRDSLSYYDQVFQALTNEIEDTILYKQLGYIYFQEKANRIARDGDYSGALQLLTKVDTMPIPKDMETRIAFYIGGRTSRTKDCESNAGFIEAQLATYPFLTARTDILALLLNCKLELMRQYIEKKNEDKSQAAFQEFNELLEKYENIMVDQNQAAATFTSAAMFYIEKGNKAEAKKMVELGMKFTTNHQPLMDLEKELK